MAKNFREVIPYFLTLLFSLFLYSYNLHSVPVHLNQDEAMFALNAKSVAESGNDFYGNKLPFYFWHLDSFWATPVIVYLTSIVLKFFAFNESNIRLSSVFLSIIDIGLMMYLVRFWLKDKKIATLSGIILALTPAFFINSRLLLDNVYPIFFVLLWLIFLLKDNYFLSGLTLGIGIHSYHAAKIYMLLYLLLSCFWIFANKKETIKKIIALGFGFIIPIVILVPWIRVHPDTFTNQISYAKSVDVNIGQNFLNNYFSYFNPNILFSLGDKSLIHSTGRVGVFLFPTFFLIVLGTVKIFLERKDFFGKLLLIGFMLFPIAPAILNDSARISRSLIVIPFGVLLAVYGVKYILDSKDKILRYCLVLILALSLLQYRHFLKDYFSNYKIISRSLFNNDIGGALESALRSTHIRKVEKIYLDNRIFMAKFYMAFYEKKLNIYPKDSVVFEINNRTLDNLPVYSLVVTSIKFPEQNRFELIETIRELDGYETYFVYYRDK